MNNLKYSLVIPCYNERGNIPLILDRLDTVFSNRNDIEIILVNNGSTDGSEIEFESRLKNRTNIKLCNVKKNQGYGFGILSGLKEANGDVLAWTHADMQTDPKDVLTAFDKFKAQADMDKNSNFDPNFMIKGKRINRKPLEALFTYGMQVIAGFLLKTKLDDINAQPKVFSKTFFKKSIEASAPNDFSLDLFLLYQAQKNGLIVHNVPVNFAARQFGEAKGGGSWRTRIKLIKRTFTYILDLKQKVNGARI